LYHAALSLPAACLAALPAGAHDGRAQVAQFSVGVQLVEVYTTVTDADGRLLKGLDRADFIVEEDGRPQSISAFAAGEFPLTIVLGVDRSWSMAGEPLRLAQRASEAFLGKLRPEDRSMVVAIGSDAEVIAPLSTDRAAQIRAVAALDPWSTTALHDAIIVALDRLEPERGRQALVVFSDGVDRYSEAPASAVLERARRSQALIYPIMLGRTRSPLAAELAVATGGRSFLLRDARGLDDTLAAIAEELRFQYLLGYVPSDFVRAGGAGWRSIEVRVPGHPGAQVRARTGYGVSADK
jgi:Ca-activated chloride channel family protein